MGAPYSDAWRVVDAPKMTPEGIALPLSRQTENVRGSRGGVGDKEMPFILILALS